MRVNLC